MGDPSHKFNGYTAKEVAELCDALARSADRMTCSHTAISFPCAADAMMWARSNRDATTAAAVFRILDGLYRQRRITLEHARIVRVWCDLRRAPGPNVPTEAADARLWRAAMEQLDPPLREIGVVR